MQDIKWWIGSHYFFQNKLYQSVIDDVISGTREAFLDEGVDEQVQQELRMLWESKLVATRAIDSTDSQGPSTANGKAKGTTNNSLYVLCPYVSAVPLLWWIANLYFIDQEVVTAAPTILMHNRRIQTLIAFLLFLRRLLHIILSHSQWCLLTLKPLFQFR